ncbi:MAG: carboxylesterase family protein, partial [Caulobacteraceae bacterium]|nr:carboxylesterase family protein [Caulobacteraceae bacterium]
AAFGGDPAKVTIAGQSAGAGAVMALLVSPQAKGLFRGAIVQSVPGVGTNGSYGPLAAAEQQGVAAFGRLGAANLAAARALPTDKIMAGGLRGSPMGDGKLLPAGSPPLASNVPVVIGYTMDDLFGNRSGVVTAAAWKAEAADRYGDKAADFLKYYPGDTDAQATHSAHMETADRTYALKLVDWLGLRGATAPVYGYLFTHVEPGPQSGQYGAFHTSDVPYEMDTLRLSPNRTFTDVDRKLADQFSSYVANFAKTGNPNGTGLPRWEAMTAQNKAIMDLGDTVTPSRAVPDGADAIIAAGRAPGRAGAAPAGGGRGAAAPAAPAGRGG